MPSALPEVCSLPRESFRVRIENLRRSLLPRVVRSSLGEGRLSFALPLEGTNVADAEAFAEYERQCCGFARFAHRVEPAESLVWVEITTDAAHQSTLVEMAKLLQPEAPAGPSGRRWLAVGGWGVVTGLLGLACCATPVVAMGAGLLGLSAATFSGLVDMTFGAVLVTSLAAVAYWVVRGRGSRSESSCGCPG